MPNTQPMSHLLPAVVKESPRSCAHLPRDTDDARSRHLLAQRHRVPKESKADCFPWQPDLFLDMNVRGAVSLFKISWCRF